MFYKKCCQSILLIFLTQIISHVTSSDSDYCYAKNPNPYHGMATRTAYHFVHENFQELTTVGKDCEIKQIWLIARHGTRYPNEKPIQLMRFILPRIRDSLLAYRNKTGPQAMCTEDYNHLKEWIMDPAMTKKNGKAFSKQGKTDFEEFAVRLKTQYPQVFNVSGDKEKKFEFKSSNSSRTIQSMKSFMLGLFHDETAVKPRKISTPDYLLQAHEACDGWKKNNGPDMLGLRIQANFTNGKMFQTLVQNVIERWNLSDAIVDWQDFLNEVSVYNKGIDSRSKLDAKVLVITTMYEMCRSEMALEVKKTSTWCAMFTNEELRVLEYREELDYYYYTGPGRAEMNKKIGCFPLKNMVRHFQAFEDDTKANEQPKGVFYFSHDAMMHAMYTAMGLFNDSNKLTENNYDEMKDRLWKTEIITPFAGNLVAVFYRCQNDTSSPYKVRFFVGEKAVEINGCEKDLCDWQKVKEKFSKAVEDCSEDYCTLSPTNKATSRSTMFSSTFLASFLILYAFN